LPFCEEEKYLFFLRTTLLVDGLQISFQILHRIGC
jgi:hypothetical protein